MSRPITTGTGVRLSAYIPRALWVRLDRYCGQLDGVPVSNIVQEALTDYLEARAAEEQQSLEYEMGRMRKKIAIDRLADAMERTISPEYNICGGVDDGRI